MTRVLREMKALLPIASFVCLTGCGDKFTDVEMHLGKEQKLRPIAVVCEPPEVAPGESVSVTLLCWAPDPTQVEVDWRVALDYDLGGYGADEVERHVVDLSGQQAIPRPIDLGGGILRQTFTYVVPDSVLLWSSALPSPLRDEATVELARETMPTGADPTSKRAVDSYLRALVPETVSTMAGSSRAVAFALADRFACRIRFRATLRGENVVDVTRNLTVRHSGRLGSPNTNLNPEVAKLEIIAIPFPDVDDPDDRRYQSEVLRYAFVATGNALPEVRVPRHADWTYYMIMTAGLQQYTSPYSGDRLFTEKDTYRWYYTRIDSPGDSFKLLRNDAGDPTEMWALDESVRLVPPEVAGEARYRILGCLRDERPEWTQYQTTPGLSVVTGDIVFVSL